jgi:hypothetical protein
MPRYLVERSFPDGLEIPIDGDGAAACLDVVGKNALEDVTWVHSYVRPDKQVSFCIYDGPDPESIRKAASRNGLPVDGITEVRVLDPYFYA